VAIRKVIGTEVEYGIAVRGDPEFNPALGSAMVVNSYPGPRVRVQWSYEEESPGRDARGFGHEGYGVSDPEGTLVNAVLGYLGEKRVMGDGSWVMGNEEGATTVVGMRAGIVHRLDKGTTGVILVARDERTQERLSALFKDRKVRKTYRAVVEGVPGLDSWTVEGNIGRHPVERKKMAVLHSGGRQAKTDFKVLERLKGFSCVEAYPATGRTHQIRVHLSHAGYPVAGDETYGRKAKRSALRPLLHAYRIEFIHPVTSKPVTIEAPVPADMVDFLEKHRGQGR